MASIVRLSYLHICNIGSFFAEPLGHSIGNLAHFMTNVPVHFLALLAVQSWDILRLQFIKVLRYFSNRTKADEQRKEQLSAESKVGPTW